MTRTDTIEHEVKFRVEPGFELPDLGAAAKGAVAVALAEQSFATVYYDTRDLRLARWGISVRCRVGEERLGRGKGRWTVKLPEGADGPALSRREIVVDAASDAIPDEVSTLVRAYARSSLLGRVAILQTTRRRHALRVGDADLAEIDDDDVSVLDDGRVAFRFRELEVELADGAPPRAIKKLTARLREAGAEPGDGTNKLVRALGHDVVGPPEVVVPGIGPSSTMGDVTRAAIADGVIRLLRHDPGLRLGGEPEDVHQARVATRRMRSDLRTFGAVLDGEPTVALRSELGWLADVLGVHRDADVLLDRIRADVAQLPASEARSTTALVRTLEGERDAAREAMLVAIESDRYVNLLETLVKTARRPPLLPAADERAVDALSSVVHRQWKKLARAVASLSDQPRDEDLHAVRILAKRARYATEASAEVIGKPAVRLARALAKLQSALGELNDSAVAEAWLLAAAGKASGRQGLAAGLLVALERDRQQRARQDWRAVWEEAKREQGRWRS